MGKWDFLIAIGGLAVVGLSIWIFKPEICKAVPRIPGLCVDTEEFLDTLGSKEEGEFDMGEGDVSLEGDMIGGQGPFYITQEELYRCPAGMFFDHCICKCVPDGSVALACHRTCPSPPAYVPGPGHTSYLPTYKQKPAIAGDPLITNACIQRCSSVPFAGGPEGHLDCMTSCTTEMLIRQGLY